jgi:hypothetical protein
MGAKTKIFSLIVLALLTLPVILGPQRSAGQVLGTSENKESGNSFPTINIPNPLSGVSSETQPIPKPPKIGEIASGTREIITTDTASIPKTLKGNVVWEDKVKSKVISDKYPKGSGIIVNYNGKSIPLVVDDSRILSTDTILVVDKDTFIKIGGNPETTLTIEIEVTN